MDLNFNNRLDEYYQKFIELQEKLKISEEQRFTLEMKFNEMVHVAKEEEQAHYRKLRAQYKKFLEEDQKRQDRNERMIRNLERVEAKISMLTAKTERISMFRRQYQKYLQRIANSDPEKIITDSKISRERSFIRKEPLKEQQPTMFRDDYSLPERPKDISKTMDKDKPLYEHPAVKKSLEKDRSNEEKIEILDKYLQSISSQRCRDVLNQEKQAREKLFRDTPIDKHFTNDFSSNATNHATAVADDIMNSIYSRYYTKADVAPKRNGIDLSKDMRNGNNEEFKPDDKTYLNTTLFGKNRGGFLENCEPTVTFIEKDNALQLKGNKEGNVLEQNDGVNFSNDCKNTSDDSYYIQDQNRHERTPKNTGSTLNPVKPVIRNDIRNDVDKTGTARNEKLIIKGAENKNEENRLINPEELNNNLPYRNNVKDSVNVDLRNNKLLETKGIVPHDPLSGMSTNSSPQVLSRKDQSQYNSIKENKSLREDQINKQPKEQLFNNPVTQDQLFAYPPNDLSHSTAKPYFPEEQSKQFNQHHDIEQFKQTTNENENNSVYLERTESGQLTGHEAYDIQDQLPIQYDQNGKGRQTMQYHPSNQPYDQNQQYENIQPNQCTPLNNQNQRYENAQSIRYNPSGDQNLPYENTQPIQYNLSDDQNQPYENAQPIQYNPSDDQNQPYENVHQLQYNASDHQDQQYENAQPIQYNRSDDQNQQYENSQPIKYNPPSDDQNQPYKNTQPIQYNPSDDQNQPYENAQPIQYNPSDDQNQPYENAQPIQYIPSDDQNQQYENSQPIKYNPPTDDQNQPYKNTQPIQYNPSDDQNQPYENAQPIQYNPSDDQNQLYENAQPIQYNPSDDQNQPYENAQPIQYNPSDDQNEQYENSQPIKYNPPTDDQNQPYKNTQPIQYNPSDDQNQPYENAQPIQYNPSDDQNQPYENAQPIQYNPSDDQNQQYENSQPIKYNPPTDDQNQPYKNTQPIQYNPSDDQKQPYENAQPIEYDPSNDQNQSYENAQPIQYNPSNDQNQPNENAQSIQYNPSDNQNQQYENSQPIQYNPSDQPLLQYDENIEQPAKFDETKQPTELVGNDSTYQPIQYDDNGRQSIQYDENGLPIGYDQYGQPLIYNQNGEIVQPQYDENGQLIPQYDENGQIIMLYDHNGQLLFHDQYKDNQQYDLNGQPIQYDNNGQPIYDQDQQQYYNYTNQEQADPSSGYSQYQGDEQGQYMESQNGQVNPHIENTGDQSQIREDGNNYNQVDQGPYPNAGVGEIGSNQNQGGTEYNQSQENSGDVVNKNKQNVGGEEPELQNNETAKPTNVLEILDTDTESVKQNTSKISNESDFDFS